MKKFLIFTGLLMGLSSCSEPILDSHEYTITDTTYIAENGFGMTLSFDVILLNHHDSCYHAGSITQSGELVEYNARPIKTLK